MASDLRTVKCSCHCGKAAFDITLSASRFPLKAHFCHCTSCRHLTGQLCLTTAAIPAEWQPEQSLLTRLQSFVFTKNVTQYFCPSCGTTLLAACTDDAECLADQGGGLDYIVNIGIFEKGDMSVYEVAAHIFVEDTLDGGMADFLTEIEGKRIKRYAGYVDGDELPLYWRGSQRAAVKKPEEDAKLHGHCKCGGVQFWLNAPSRRSIWPKEAYEGMEIPSGFPEESRLTLKSNWSKFPAAVCPCDSCRLAANGQAFGFWAYVPTVDVTLDADGRSPMPKNLQWGTLKEYSFTDRTSLHFCGVCGAMVFWNTKARPWLKDFGVGLFDSPDGARCESWFSWRTTPLNHREDGLARAKSLTLAVEDGLQRYETNVQSKTSPGEAVV